MTGAACSSSTAFSTNRRVVRSDQDLACTRSLLEPLRGVHRIPRDERRRFVAGDDFAGVDPDPDAERRPTLVVELGVQPGECGAHLDCGSDCAQRIVLVDVWNTEHRHDRIADELLDGAAVPLDRRTHFLVPASEQAAERLGVEALPELGRVRQVAEEDRDRLAHRGGGRRRGLAQQHGRRLAARRRVERREVESRILVENLLVQLTKPGPGLDAELVDEGGSPVLIGRERLGLAAGAVQGQHELRAQVLAGRVRLRESRELSDQLGVPSLREVALDALLETRQAELLQPGDVGLGEAVAGELRERISAPERQCFGRLPAVVEAFEADEIELIRLDPQQVAAAAGLDALSAEQLPQL